MIGNVIKAIGLIVGIIILSSTSQGLTKALPDLEKGKITNQEILDLKQKMEFLEKRDSQKQLETANLILSISGNTIKYVGVIATIVLPLIIFLIGYQVIRAYQFDREIRETKKLMSDEYIKLIALTSDAGKIVDETKTKVDSLQTFVGELATKFLSQRTAGLESEVKERAEQILAEIKTKQESEMEKNIDLMKKLETLDMTLTPSIYVERGIVYIDQKNYEKAVENLTNAINQKKDSFEAYFQRGRAYQSLLKYDNAMGDYEIAKKLDPKQPATYANIGIIYDKQGKYDLAIENFSKAIALFPKYEFAYNQRIETYNRMGKYELAINDLKEIDNIRPNNSEILNRIGFYYGKLRNFALSYEYYQKAIGLRKDVHYLLNLSESLICLKNVSEAEGKAREAIELSKTVREKIFSKYSLVQILILSEKEYTLELKELIEIFKANPEFSVENWSFDEILYCLPNFPLDDKEKTLIEKIMKMLKKEIIPEEILREITPTT